jgi:hypothetical protein
MMTGAITFGRSPCRTFPSLHLVLLVSLAGCLVSSLIGCGSADDPRIAAQRKRLVLADEPADATSILDAKQQLADERDVTLVGTIGGDDQNTAKGNVASFVLAELASDGHGADHDAGNCPFCKRRKAETPLVVVQMVDEQGQVLPIDARRLLGVERGQVVVVRGKSQHSDRLDLFIVTADGIHIRR